MFPIYITVPPYLFSNYHGSINLQCYIGSRYYIENHNLLRQITDNPSVGTEDIDNLTWLIATEFNVTYLPIMEYIRNNESNVKYEKSNHKITKFVVLL